MHTPTCTYILGNIPHFYPALHVGTANNHTHILSNTLYFYLILLTGTADRPLIFFNKVDYKDDL